MAIKRTRYQAVPVFWAEKPRPIQQGQVPPSKELAEHLRKLAQALNEAQEGRLNVTYDVTLTASAMSTKLESPRFSAFSIPVLAPKSASAAAALSLIWFEVEAGSITFHHDSDPVTDRAFGVLVLG